MVGAPWQVKQVSGDHAMGGDWHENFPRNSRHYLWAVLITRIYEVFSLLSPLCGGQMRLIAFVTEGTQIRWILDHSGVGSEPPHMAHHVKVRYLTSPD
jgi:hypothetical protein